MIIASSPLGVMFLSCMILVVSSLPSYQKCFVSSLVVPPPSWLGHPSPCHHRDYRDIPSDFHSASLGIDPTRSRNSRNLMPHPNKKRVATILLALAPQSLPPINLELNSNNAASTTNNQDIKSVKDYFLPTYSEEATRQALEQYAKSKQQSANLGASMIQSEDFIQFDTAMPGAKGSKPIPKSSALLPTPTYNKEIDKEELLWISQQFDIYLRRLPQAAILYALLDFFVLPTSRAVMSDELEEDRMKVVKEWASRTVFRVGVFSTIVAATVVFENLFYHPI